MLLIKVVLNKLTTDMAFIVFYTVQHGVLTAVLLLSVM